MVLKVCLEWAFYACIFWARVRRPQLSEWACYQWTLVWARVEHFWMAPNSRMALHSECNAIPIGYPVRQTLATSVVQTSINNLNVFKSFQLMLTPPSILLSNAWVSKRFVRGPHKRLHNRSMARHLTYVSRYVAMSQIKKFFVNILFFHYSQNVSAAGWNGFASRICPADRSLKTPNLMKWSSLA